MKKGIALFLTLALLLALLPAIALATTTEAADAATFGTAVTNASSGDTIKLTDNIAVTDAVVVDSKTLTLDLNGFTLSRTDTATSANLVCLKITSGGKVTVDGNGKILCEDLETAKCPFAVVVEGSGSEFTLKSGTVEAKAPNDCETQAIRIEQSAKATIDGGTVQGVFGVVTRFNSASLVMTNGTVKSVGTYDGQTGHGISGNGTAGNGNTTITISGGNVIGGIYHPQAGTLNITGGTVTGVDSGIAIKSGTLNISGSATVSCTGPNSAPTTGFSNGVNASGAAIQIESNALYAGNVAVTISGGTITSSRGNSLYEYVNGSDGTKVSSISITGGKFKGGIQISEALAAANGKPSISGGHFTTSPAAYKAEDKYVVPSTETGYTYMVTSDAPSTTTTIMAEETEATVARELQTEADSDANVKKVVDEIKAAVNGGDVKVEGVADAISPTGKDAIIAGAKAATPSGTPAPTIPENAVIEIEVTAKVETKAVAVDTTGTPTSVEFEIKPVANVTVNNNPYGGEVVVSDSWLNGKPITVSLPNPLGANLQEIVHEFQSGGQEAFHKTGSKVFTLSEDDTIASIVITKFSPVKMTAKINYPEAVPSSSGGPSVYYKGGNTFGASRSDAPTQVLINNTPVAFSANNGVITVSGMPAGANWVTVKWGSTSASTNFKPNGVLTTIANVELPKTGDASVLAMALCSLAAAAAVFKKR